ncbi:MAG: xanthine dehydrogenase family protein subunit M [Thermaerobacter sp.]|nr:xanthine dehydrogenase family protein subunit M [Thermaerobacter sp.]
MYPLPFVYKKAQSIAEAVAWAGDDSRFLAGGQSLLPMLNLQLASVGLLIDVNAIAELAAIGEDRAALSVGALTRHDTLARHATVRRASPLLAEAASLVGNPRVRRRGTLGGSVAQADPAAELVTALLALDAEIDVVSPDGRQRYTVPSLMLGPLLTVLRSQELVVGVRVPHREPAEGQAFVEVARREGDFALVAVAARLWIRSGRVARAAIAVGGAAEMPIRLADLEAWLKGQKAGAPLWDAAGERVSDEVRAVGDPFAGAAYRTHLSRVLVCRALAQAERARGAS